MNVTKTEIVKLKVLPYSYGKLLNFDVQNAFIENLLPKRDVRSCNRVHQALKWKILYVRLSVSRKLLWQN